MTDTNSNKSQIWAYTYHIDGRLASIDGPRTDVTDVTTFSYHPSGDLHSITNALSQTTIYSDYTPDGRVGKITHPSGMETSFTYTARGWIDTAIRSGLTTDFDYDAVGNLIKVTYPDLSYIEYVYDDAHRLTEINDADGNRLVYVLDNAGNRIQTTMYDSSNTLVFTQSKTFNNLGRLHTVVGALNQTLEYGYDANGNITSITNGLGHQVEYGYDTLNRPVGDSSFDLGRSSYISYDQNGRVSHVGDYNWLETNYVYNGLSQLIELVSSDTGSTTYTYDDASNLKVKLDADGRQLSYSYDALNRITNITGSGYAVTIGYDEEPNSTGQLGSITDSFGNTKWMYNNIGSVQSRAHTYNSVSLSTQYTYDFAGRPATITYPSSHVLGFSYSSNGDVTALSVNGSPLITGISRSSFLGMSGWQTANSIGYERTFNLDGRVSSVSYPTSTKNYVYDDAYQITAITDTSNPSGSSAMTYDDVGRLTSQTRGGSTTEWQYDFNGNRIVELMDSVWRELSLDGNQVTHVYRYDTYETERLLAYDDAGHLIQDNDLNLHYDTAGRLVQITDASGIIASYVYNALGQRVMKTVGTLITHFVYDEQGQVLGEYESGGISREYVWLDNVPMMAIHSNGAGVQIYYIHPDHLNTPRFLTNSSGTVVWQWDGDAFGNGSANEDADGDSQSVRLSLRFPGQLFDIETGKHYNYFRDYDPSLGRYMQSDPIGLEGGLNTYIYVEGNPLNYMDPLGLTPRQRNSVELWCLKYPKLCKEQERHIYDSLKKKKKSKISGKEGSKDCPSWAKEDGGPLENEPGKDYAKRLLDEKYGPDGWSDMGQGSEFSQIKKWADRAFE